jgi:hypothetical protein
MIKLSIPRLTVTKKIKKRDAGFPEAVGKSCPWW